ncbi:hypothetical protein RHGRI_018559 [Rhododendron griersonianum]|uniref:Alpha/beta-hydrolase n=1 Tax=Rhododendron griersonianum TaxID=479676 RepID=A0AAV6K1U9_9ERIC|nr:hypothetical protein RHGRI_018559 [Rhododendron griersonianum]
MQRLVDNVLAVTKESVKAFTYESLNHIVRLINGISALLLAILPGKTSILEGIHGWELRPTFRGPSGVSSFNQFIHELSVESDASSSVDYSSGEENCDDNIIPASPLSQSSRVSRASSFNKFDRRWTRWTRLVFSLLLCPVKFLLGIPLYLFHSLCYRGVANPRGTHSSKLSRVRSARGVQALKDHFIQRTTDRRRGVIEDLHLAIEIYIESIFEFVHKAAHIVLSPSETFRVLFGWFSSQSNGSEDIAAGDLDATVPTSTLGEDNPTPTERKTNFHPLNTDARTCRDVITELGYPYEAIPVTGITEGGLSSTWDNGFIYGVSNTFLSPLLANKNGYILIDYAAVIFLSISDKKKQDKSYLLLSNAVDFLLNSLFSFIKPCWVSNGVVGSPAFAAFDQGYDVFLGNLRGLVSREHVDKSISSRQYWHYSINEHGTEDIPAMLEKIHEVKVSELKSTHPLLEEESNRDQPYKLCAICHSLGGAGILMYIITRRIEEKPHRLSRLILLSPAGFHDDSNLMFTVVEYIFLLLAPILVPLVPGLYIPTRFFRMLLNKLARDFHNYPAVGGLVQTLMSYVVGGDSSNWIGVIGLPHYNMNDMPGVSLLVALHLAQMKRTKKFQMFDYGSAAANMEMYGSPEPLDLGEYYGLIDVPVDLVAGHKDKVIRPSMVRKHSKLMRDSGVEVSYNEFEYAHLDFTFSHHEELLAYVMSRLRLVEPARRQPFRENFVRLKKKE